MDKEGEVAQGQLHEAADTVQAAELADVDDEDVDLDSRGEDVEEREHHGEQGDAQENHTVVKPATHFEE